MAINTEAVGEKISNLLKGYGFVVQNFKDSELVVNPQEANRFVVADPNIVVRLSVADSSIDLMTNQDLNEHPIRRQLKNIANKFLLNFDYQVFGKKLSIKGEQEDIEKNKEKDMSDVMESSGKWVGRGYDRGAYFALHTGTGDMKRFPVDIKSVVDDETHDLYFGKAKRERNNWIKRQNNKNHKRKDMAEVMEAGFGSMSGSSKTSYQPLDSVKIVVRHNKPVNEEVRGARSRNIHSIYIQRGEERFKMAENNLSAARAMARHLHNGGETFDTVGQQISTLAEDYRKLREFVSYVRRAGIVNENNEEYVNLARESVSNIKGMLTRISKPKGYSQAISEMDSYFTNTTENLNEDELDLESLFTETHFDNKVENAMSNLRGLVGKQQAYRSTITKALESETFDGLKDMLSETFIEFDNPRGQLAHQVTQMGSVAQNPQLSNFLRGVGEKINGGGNLNQFEYSTVKAALLSVNEPKLKENKEEDVMESYENLLDSFIII